MNDVHDSGFDLNLLKVMDALLEERHLTRAAERLGMSQSGMSHALSRLREFYGDPLFVRGTGGMQPTARALALRVPVGSVMNVVRHEVLAQATFVPRTARRTFTLCLSSLAEIEFLPGIIRLLQEQAPGCTLRTLQVPSKLLPDILESGEADLAIGALSNMAETLYQQLLFTRPFVTVVSKRNTRYPDELTVEQFEAAQHIVLDLGDSLRSVFDQVVEEAGLQRKIFLRTPHFLCVPLLLDEHPEMIATVPYALERQFARFDLLRRLSPPVALPRMALRQFWHPRYNRDPANVWLRNTVRQLFGENAG